MCPQNNNDSSIGEWNDSLVFDFLWSSVNTREGISAVVGCGDATMRLKTEDRVRVDGGAGVIEVIEGWI